MEEKKERAREGSSNAQEKLEETKEYRSSSTILYQEETDLSTPNKKKFDGTGIREECCIHCGRVFIPTRPEYAYGDCCSWSCLNRHREKIAQEGLSERVVMMNAYDKRELRVFASAQEAADHLGVRRESVRDACNGRQKTCKGFAFRWAEVGKFEIDRVPKQYARSSYRKGEVISLHLDTGTLNKVEKLAQEKNVRRSVMLRTLIYEGIELLEDNEDYEIY